MLRSQTEGELVQAVTGRASLRSDGPRKNPMSRLLCIPQSISNGYLARFWQILPESCKITIFLPESCKITIFCKILAESCKITIRSRLGFISRACVLNVRLRRTPPPSHPWCSLVENRLFLCQNDKTFNCFLVDIVFVR